MGKDPFYMLELAQKHLEEGNEDGARQLILLYADEVPPNGDLCFKWAKVCEELGMARQAIKFYMKALRAGPVSGDILFNYAVLLSDIGHYEDSIHYLRKAIKADPEHEEARKLLSEIYEVIGLFGQAEVLCKKPDQKKEPLRYFPPTISDEHLNRLFYLFSGREVGYAIQGLDQITGDPVYRFQNAPMSHDLLLNHILGEITLAVYPIRIDKTLKYTAINISVKNRVLKENIKNLGYLKYLEEKACSYALSLRRLATQMGIPAYVDSSGGFSFRVWFFFKEFVHFLKARRFLKEFLEHAPSPDNYLDIDSLIGTRGVGIGWSEHPVMLPFGLNLATKKRALFLDEEGNPYPDQLLFLKKIREAPFKDSFQMIKMPQSSSEKEISIVGLPVTIERMVSLCSVLKEIVRKAGSGWILSREEKIILFYTVGILDQEGTTLHAVLSPCPDYNYTKVERQRVRLKLNPISCVKIREMIPDTTASLPCNCTFDLRGGRYPSPVMHINPYMIPPREEFEMTDSLFIKDVAKRYISLKRQEKEIEMAIKKAIRLLEKHYVRTGREAIYADGVVVYRINDEGKIRWEIEK